MSTLSQFTGGGGIKPTLISGALTFKNTINTAQASVNAVVDGASIGTVVTCPYVSANTLATVLSLSGRGGISLFSIGNNGAAATHRVKITLDGVVIYDSTSSNTSANQTQSANVIGSVCRAEGGGQNIVASYEPLLFDASLLIEYACSSSSAAKAVYKYYAR